MQTAQVPQRPRFHPSHKHVKAKQVILGLSALSEALDGDVFEAVRFRVLEHLYGEMAAFLLREDYTFVRNSTHVQRRLAKELLRLVVRQAFPEFFTFPDLTSSQFSAARLAHFRANGIGTFGRYVGTSEYDDILQYLEEHPVYNAHIAGCSDSVPRHIGSKDDAAESYQFGAYAEPVIARLPHIEKIVLNADLLAFLKAYFGVPAVLRDLHLWWSFPLPTKFGPQPHAGQQFHRDYRAIQDIQFFVCLSEMPTVDGAHEYFMGTHDEAAFSHGLEGRLSSEPASVQDLVQRVFYPPGDGYGQDEGWATMLAPSLLQVPMRAGHCLMIDTMGLHRGVPPRLQPRLMLSARFCSSGSEGVICERTQNPDAPPVSELGYTLSAISEKLGEELETEWRTKA
jgi:hypothetical protein